MLDLNKNQAEKYCRITKISYLYNFLGKEIFFRKSTGLKCDIQNSDFTLDNTSFYAIAKNIKEYETTKRIKFFEFNWSIDKKASSSLTQQFNLSALMEFFKYTNYSAKIIIRNLKSIELQLFTKSYNSISIILIFNSDLRFTIDLKTVKTCADIKIVQSKITSLFQIPFGNEKKIFLFGCRFPVTLCPLIFLNNNIHKLFIFNLIDTFYKTNLMKFSNETFEDANSSIYSLYLYNCENIDLDVSFLNSSVFKN